MKTPYYQYKQFMIDKYGTALFRIPIDLGFSCPNRDHNKKGGCTFCSEDGSRAIQNRNAATIYQQIEDAFKFSKQRYKAKKFMAYIQAYTASFTPKNIEKYQEILNSYDFSAVSFGVRPDVLNSKAYDFLTKINQQLETLVELGVQTVHDKTLLKINRGHNFASSKRAILKLHSLGLKVIVHVIIGLNDETEEDILATAKTLGKLPIDGIKIHNLLILKNSPLAENYQNLNLGLFKEVEYAEILIKFLRYIPAHIPIMRITSDALNENLIAPKWQMSKGQFIEYLSFQMINREIFQGDLTPNFQREEKEQENYQTVTTDDGSLTVYNQSYKEHYHTKRGALLEATEKYLKPAKLPEKIQKNNLNLLDICFGMGYNSLCSLKAAQNKTHQLMIDAIELDKRIVKKARELAIVPNQDKILFQNILDNLYQHSFYQNKNCKIKIHYFDARYLIPKLKPNSYDIIYLDAFSTQRNSELWTLDFFQKIKNVIKKDGVLLTYASAIPVRSALLKAGFFVGETEPVARKRSGTIASLDKNQITKELPVEELARINSLRGIPYRDPYGIWSNKEILRERQEKIIASKKNISNEI